MVLTFGVLMGQPRWKLAPFAPTANRNYFDARAWSPDGSVVMTAAGGGRFEIVRSDGTLLLADTEGMTPLWIDDRTVIALETVDESTSRLVRIDAYDGSRRLIGGPLPLGHLVGGAPGMVAHRTVIGPLVSTILDPVDGRVLGRLAGYRAHTWANDGSLIVRKPEPAIQNSHYGAGPLFDWRPGEDPRPLAPGLIDLGEASPLSPSGDAVACVCALTSSLGRDPARAIYRVPIDGSPPTELGPWHAGNSSAMPEITWQGPDSLAVVDADGLSRVFVTGKKQTIPGLSASELGFQRPMGRVYGLGDTVVAIIRDGAPPGNEPILVVVDAHDRIRLERVVEAFNVPSLTVDEAHGRGLITADPNHPGEPPQEFFLLEFR
jgi:hypothetical protein